MCRHKMVNDTQLVNWFFKRPPHWPQEVQVEPPKTNEKPTLSIELLGSAFWGPKVPGASTQPQKYGREKFGIFLYHLEDLSHGI